MKKEMKGWCYVQNIAYEELFLTDKAESIVTLKFDNNGKKERNKKFMMHKYWGKKPAAELREIVYKYSRAEDTLLDPFAGYGGFSAEAVLANRNVISNDLNPISNFINKCLLMTDINFEKLDRYVAKIDSDVVEFENLWYSYCSNSKITTALRDRSGNVKKLKVIYDGEKTIEELIPSEDYIRQFHYLEANYKIVDWFPNEKLIENSRISSKKNMFVSCLFDKRSLACHSRLFSIIESLPNTNEKDLIKFAFTSNLANCSKLVPPIKSRGEMSQGAWMTGFYFGETYLENNVFHYFRNRLKKVISGKKEFVEQYYDMFPKGTYRVTNNDAKKLELSDNSIDLVFTDFPYGDAVPYFEQSVIWNSWLGFSVDYENEIVISDSTERDKGKEVFSKDLSASIEEIYRVLKPDKYFVFTYHSLSGFEWSSITNALITAGFEIEDCKLAIQKTFTPRQLNRSKTIKGDLVLVCRKTEVSGEYSILDICEERSEVKKMFIDVLNLKLYYTNDILVAFLKKFFNSRMLVKNTNIISLLEEVACYDGKGWVLNEDF